MKEAIGKMSKRNSVSGLRYSKFKASFYHKLKVDEETRTLIKFLNLKQQQC